jgi:SPP1 gp7 family putative phage head morphogenesis protein
MPTDPTRTLSIRRRYESEIVRRIRNLARLVAWAVGEVDALALGSGVFAHAAFAPDFDDIPPPRFNFPTSAEKVAAFLAWLREMQDQGILEVIERSEGRIVARQPWQDVYIRSAYQKGLADARRDLRIPPAVESGPFGLPADAMFGSPFNAPIHADAAGMLFTRNFEELAGITSDMSQRMSRVLTQGLTEGRGPRQIASALRREIEGMPLTRARMIARTEVIRAHYEAKLNQFETFEVEGISIQAEILTAGDGRVCERCNGLQLRTSRNPIPISQARGLIPLHPQCRCTAIPANVGENRAAREERARLAAIRSRIGQEAA